MKKLLLFIFTFIISIGLSSCAKSTQSLANKIQSELPLHIVGMGEINSVYAEDNNLVFATDASTRGLNYDIIRKDDYETPILQNAGRLINQLGILEDLYDTEADVIFRFQWDEGAKLDAKLQNSEITYLALHGSKRH